VAQAEARWIQRGPAIAVCEVAACNGLAFTSHQTWAWRRAELAAVGPSPFRDARGEQLSAVSMQVLPPSLFGSERVAEIAARPIDALGETLDRVGRGARVEVALCLPTGARSRGFGRVIRAAFERRLSGADALELWSQFAHDHSSLAAALGEVLPRLEHGAVDLAVVGGVDTYHDPDAVEALLADGRVLHGDNVDAMIPGEGASFMLLARGDVARRLGLRVVALVEGSAWRAGPDRAGAGMTSVLASLFEGVRERRETVDWWIDDLTGEPFRTREKQLWLPRASAGTVSANARMESLPTLLGDLGAATMPTGVSVAAEGFSRGATGAERCVVLGSSVDGARGAVLLTRASR
jgi:3-oxoacyl-[acyl-carrier-protein] synthase-1